VPAVPATSFRRVRIVSRLTTLTKMRQVSRSRAATSPRAAVWLTRFMTGYSTRAVLMPARPTMTSDRAPLHPGGTAGAQDESTWVILHRFVEGEGGDGDGARRGPLEDSGGLPGYEEMMDALADPSHPDHAEHCRIDF
jgi:hypothetical protein